MKFITKYVADDGTEFEKAADCRAYEALYAEIAAIVARLNPLPDDPKYQFHNGHGFVQQDRKTVTAVRLALLHIADQICPHKWITEAIENPSVHPSWAARIISESSIPLYAAWFRILCIDAQGREWGQPHCADDANREVV